MCHRVFKGGGDINNKKQLESKNRREEVLTCALCQALIVKKMVFAGRFEMPEIKDTPIECHKDCHVCCKISVTLDLTAVESLLIYLLNQGVVTLIEEYTSLHEDTGYCPFMITGKCIINTYKPTACQMYMPFEYKGQPMCYYLAKGGELPQGGCFPDIYMNSNSYDIHGFMLMMQTDIDRYSSHSFFKNAYEGTLWWEKHYHDLPADTRVCLESILNENYIGLQLMEDFNYEEALLAGHEKYVNLLDNKPIV